MMKSPFVHAGAAFIYIAAVVGLIQFLAVLDGPNEDMVVIPVAMLSLLVLSVATMAFLFFYQPIMLYLDGDKQGAIRFFLKTLFAFGALTAALFTVLIVLAL